MPLTVLTPDDLAPLEGLVRQVLAHQTAGAQPADDYLSVDQVAALVGHSAKTVRKWIEHGKPATAGQQVGRIIKLFALEFAPGYPRVPRSALLAFGQGLGFEAAQLALPPAGATKPAKPKRAGPVLASDEALRVAS